MRNWVSPLIKLVVFLVVTTLATYVLAATIANASYGSTYSYTANFTDATGLELGDDVRIAGVRVGSVKNIKIYKKTTKTGQVRTLAQIDFSVQKSTPLPQSVELYMRYRNLVGQRYIDIEQGPGNSNKVLAPGSTITVDHTNPAVDLTQLFNGFQPLTQALDAKQINHLSYNLIQTLQGEGGGIESLLATVADLTNSLADKDQVIGDVIDNLTSVLEAVNRRDNNLSNLIIELKDFIGGLANDRGTISSAIDGINRLAVSTTGLLTQVRGPFREDVKSITRLVDVLNKNSGTLTYVIRQLPPTVAALIRTADYGSWFNFYLCSSSGVLVLPGKGHQSTKIPLGDVVNGSHPRCNS